jgi:hypothetical protein
MTSAREVFSRNTWLWHIAIHLPLRGGIGGYLVAMIPSLYDEKDLPHSNTICWAFLSQMKCHKEQ